MAMATVEGSPKKRLSLYERSMRFRAERERRLRLLEYKLLEDCTFQPCIGRKSTEHTSGAVERLSQRSDHSRPLAKTPQCRFSSFPRTSPATTVTAAASTSPSANSTPPMIDRLERIYQHGVRKLQRRPKSDKEERAVRDRLQYERERSECTFTPVKQSRYPTTDKKKKSKLVMKPNTNRTPYKRSQKAVPPPPRAKSPPPPVPLEIFINRDRSWDTPPRRQQEGEQREDWLGDTRSPADFANAYLSDLLIDVVSGRPGPDRNASITASAGAATDYGSI